MDLLSQNYAAGRKSYILALTFTDLTAALPTLARMGYGADAWELRVDLISPTPIGATNVPPLEYVAQQLELLQKHSSLPVLFTVRTVSQGGKFPDGAGEQALALWRLAVRAGCQYIDVEVTWPPALVETFKTERGSTKIVASFHDWTGKLPWTDSHVREQYTRAHAIGDITKISILAATVYDCHELALFVRDQKSTSSKPIIAVAMGPRGQLSRVTSPISLVTHELIPFPAAPGQLSLREIHQAMHLIGQLPKRQFFIFGNNIQHSLSPTLHNAGFRELGLPHFYRIFETESVDERVREIIESADFGGASVTFPHKLQIGKYLHEFSDSARLVGAVNTVAVRMDNAGKRLLVGDNTDWLGIQACILHSAAEKARFEVGLVVGAGGAARAACFALQEIGVGKIIMVNRTREKAESVARDFPKIEFVMFSSLEELAPGGGATVIVSCVPADDFNEADIPTHLFDSTTSGVLVEMAYRPQVTALMKVAGRHPGWQVRRGTDVLKEQAYGQFQIWTERPAPVSVMAAALESHAG